MSDTIDILKLVPEAVLKPWGLRHGELLACTGIRVGVGELWLASAQTGAGNYSNAVAEPPLGRTLAQLLAEAAKQGDETLARIIGAGALRALRSSPHRGKTEAWHVREAAGRTGVAAGPRTPGQKAALRELIESGKLGADVENWPRRVRDIFGLIEPLKGGEVFLVPAGTLHTMFAIGEDSRLVIDEIQQGYGNALLPTLSKILLVQDSLLSVQVHPDDETVRRAAEGELKVKQDLQANPTVRVYDFGRRPGEDRELGFKLTDVETGLRRVTPVEVSLGRSARMTVLAASRCFVKSQLELAVGAEVVLQPAYGSYRVLHCRRGAATLRARERTTSLAAGETALVPAALENGLRIKAEANCLIYEDAVPDLDALRAFLLGAGASERAVTALLDPPRALQG